ncbi:MAG: HAMP domain-containing histidine kinase [Lachnospiraceae bacterium]|nr:HAMP domain-containing histidine kinase [Lachnospiraceae bacterium]
MKINYRTRWLLAYLVLLTVFLLILNTYGKKLIFKTTYENTETLLYNEATQLSQAYVNDISLEKEDNEKSLTALKNALTTVQLGTQTRIWLVNKKGVIILDSYNDKLKDIDITKYNKHFLMNQTYNGSSLDKIVPKRSFYVIYPLSVDMKINGYLVVSKTVENIDKQATIYNDNIIICYFIFIIILTIVMLFLYLDFHRPLKKITETTKQYAKGNFDYDIGKRPQNEYYKLYDAIKYIGEKTSGMKEEEKKFIANVSHDFRSPLTSIKGYSQALADGTIPPEMYEKYLNIILFETERLNKLTSNLLELNNFENNGMVIEAERFELNSCIRMTLAGFEERCKKKKISINLLLEGKHVYVMADMFKIEQVIQNLTDNAIKFSEPNSEITISTNIQGSKVFVSVKDRGIGIPKENLDKIWERFYKTDHSRGKDKTGSGLGLSIVREILLAHGEKINVASTKNAGTEFTFSLKKVD